jgi:hypothetical protein
MKEAKQEMEECGWTKIKQRKLIENKQRNKLKTDERKMGIFQNVAQFSCRV